MRRRAVVVVLADDDNDKEEEELWPERVLASSDGAWLAPFLTPPRAVLEPSEASVWSARAGAPAWILFDFGPSRPCVRRVALLPSMQAAGAVEHRIRVGRAPEAMETVHVIRGTHRDREWICCTLPDHAARHARFLEVLTTRCPCAVAWARIRMWSSARASSS